MKQILSIFAVAALLTACNAPNADKAKTDEKQTEKTAAGDAYSVDSTSTLSWTGSKPTGNHTGVFPVKTGSLFVKDNTLTGGEFEIDVMGIKNHDLASDPENQGKLEGHLKSSDFFDCAKYPSAKFVVTNVAPYVADSTQKTVIAGATHTITGNLTLKDVTKSVSFPAKVTVDAATAAAAADFNIDRTEWGLNYKGPGNPQDWIINKTVNIKVDLKATKK